MKPINYEEKMRSLSTSTQFVYKGYRVTWIPVEQQYTITKDGYHICWARSAAKAAEAIDEIA